MSLRELTQVCGVSFPDTGKGDVMKALGTVIAVVVLAFVGIFAFYWWDRGSMQEAGAEMDEGLAEIDRTTEPLQRSMGELGEATVESINRATENATDDDDGT